MIVKVHVHYRTCTCIAGNSLLDKIVVENFAGLNFCAFAKVYSNFVDLIFVDFSLSKNLILANISCYTCTVQLYMDDSHDTIIIHVHVVHVHVVHVQCTLLCTQYTTIHALYTLIQYMYCY